jgi:hypothetical protein
VGEARPLPLQPPAETALPKFAKRFWLSKAVRILVVLGGEHLTPAESFGQTAKPTLPRGASCLLVEPSGHGPSNMRSTSSSSGVVDRILQRQRGALSRMRSTIKSQFHDNPYLQLFRFHSKDILVVVDRAASPLPPTGGRAQSSRNGRASAEPPETMQARDTNDDEWADKTIPNLDPRVNDSLVHDSLAPHALASQDLDDSSAGVSPSRAWMGPLVAIGSVLAMACALPVIGWAAHRPASANGSGGEDDTPTVQAAAPASPVPAVANGGSASPNAAPDALGAWPSGAASLNGHSSASDKARKKRTPSKHASDRVAGLASAVAGLASAAAEPPGGPVEPASTLAAESRGVASSAPVTDRAPAEQRSAKPPPSVHSQTRAQATAKSVEDEAAAELSSALK